jgi:hypothetical protein
MIWMGIQQYDMILGPKHRMEAVTHDHFAFAIALPIDLPRSILESILGTFRARLRGPHHGQTSQQCGESESGNLPHFEVCPWSTETLFTSCGCSFLSLR